MRTPSALIGVAVRQMHIPPWLWFRYWMLALSSFLVGSTLIWETALATVAV